MQYLSCPFPKLKVTQYHNGSYSHQGSDAWDITDGVAGSKAPYYAPCDVVCKAIDTNYCFTWWQSTAPVKFADGTEDYCVVMFGHDESIDCYIGQTISKGSQIGNMGAGGTATGVHCHIEVAKGSYVGKWYANSYGVYCLYNSIKFYDAFFMDGVEVIECSYSSNFKYYGGGSDPEPEPTPVFHSKNAFLSESEMQDNAKYIYAKLSKSGWTLNAIAGMLGNMETESTINPGIWQNLDSGNTSLGYGLVQWTPATKYIDWCNDKGIEPSHMDSALARIEYEVNTPGLQWIATSTYNFSFEDFKKSTLSPEYLADAFLKNYERPADGEQPNRQTQARYWYDWLIENGGYVPTPTPSIKNKKGYRWVIFNPTHLRS